jgi:hypothetical protein
MTVPSAPWCFVHAGAALTLSPPAAVRASSVRAGGQSWLLMEV